MGTSGVKLNWPVIAIAGAVMAVPFGIALVQDAGSKAGGAPKEDDARLAELEGYEEAADEEAADEEEAADGDDTAALGRWQRPAMEQRFFDEVLLAGGARPALAGALVGVRFGATWDELAAAAPALVAWADGDATPFERADLHLVFEGGDRLRALELSFPDDGTGRRVLASAWGDPVMARGGDDEVRAFWFAPDAGLRVMHEQDGERGVVTIDEYQPVARLYDRASRRFFGLDLFALRAAEVGADPDGVAPVTGCPVTEFARSGAPCELRFSGGAASELRITIDHGWNADAGEEIVAELTRQFGPVREEERDEAGVRYRFAGRIAVDRARDSFNLIVIASR